MAPYRKIGFCEARNADGQYVGIFSFFNPSQRCYFSRFVKEPKWYEKNPDVESRCWFTKEGYDKYHDIIEGFIAENNIRNFRILKRESLEGKIVCRGKIQCIKITT